MLNGSGQFTIEVPATDDPDWTPVDWTYQVSINLSESVSTFNLRIPHDAPGGSISLSDLLPVAASTGNSYAPYNHEHSGYVQTSELNDAVSAAIDTELGPTIDAAVDEALVTALDPYAPLESPTFTGTVSGITKAMVGLGQVDNTADLDKPVSTAVQTALDGKSSTSHDHDSLYVSRNIVTTKGDLLVATASGVLARLPVDAVDGKVLKTDSGTSTGLTWGTDNSGEGGGSGTITSVNGDTGPEVVLDKADIGLGNVDNTSDANKPVSTATQTALDAKAPINSPTFTGSVSGITKSMVGLGNVDNTSDANKPVSTATQTALNLKADLDSPTFTGTPSAPTAAANTRTTQVANTTHTWTVIEQRLNFLDVGEEVFPREWANSEIAPDSGRLMLSYFTARKTETINRLLTGTGGAAYVGSAPSGRARIGIYSVAGNGDLTLVASTTNDLTLWSATYTTYTPLLSSSFSKVAGNRYAIGILCVGTTMPQIECCQVRYHSAERSPRIQGELAGQTDLPSSVTAGSLGRGFRKYQMIMLPS